MVIDLMLGSECIHTVELYDDNEKMRTCPEAKRDENLNES